MPKYRGIGVGLLGAGVVGSRVAEFLLAEPSGEDLNFHHHPLTLRSILIRNPQKDREFQIPPELVTTDPAALLENPDIDLIIEVMGGEYPAADYLNRAITNSKHVVTANKEVMAKHGPELLAQAAKFNVQLRFEASVGGGIPIIGPLSNNLVADDLYSIRAIINGTTNFILSSMVRGRLSFETALEEAQRLGYAERDPSNDIDGTDAAYKLAILASLAFQTRIHTSDIYVEGIRNLHTKDFQYASELGYAIKLLAVGKKGANDVQVRVHPTLIPKEDLLAKVEGAYNAIQIEGRLIGSVMFSGLGAGGLPTASAVLSDALGIARHLVSQERAPLTDGMLPSGDPVGKTLHVQPLDELKTQYYIRLSVHDRSGVLAQIASIMGDHGISIASVIQKDANLSLGTAEIVITTHPSRAVAMQKALANFRILPVVDAVESLIRLETASL